MDTSLSTIANAKVEINILGPLRITFDGRDIDLQSRKARAIIGILAMSEEMKLPRERFLGLLWSEAETDRARAALRTTIWEARSQLHQAGCGDVLGVDRLAIWIDRDKVAIDLAQAIAGAKAGAPTHPLLDGDRVTERILDDCENVDPSFRDWLTAKRQSTQNRLLADLEDALRRLPDGEASPKAEPIARAIARLDPTNEEAARALIRSRVAAGDLGSAFGIYKALWDLLSSEFEVQPAEETQDLIAALRLGQSEPTEGPSAPVLAPALLSASAQAIDMPPPARPNLARKLVLNICGFDADGVKPDNRYLINGFRQELSACLIRFREWSVRDQAASKAGAVRPGAQDGEYAIDASAFEAADGVRLVLMLRDAISNDYVWSERLHLSLSSWSDIQQAVVRRLATALNVRVSAARLAASGAVPAADPAVFDIWLQAQTAFHKYSPADWQRGIDLLHETLRRMPTYSPAFTSLANAYNSQHIAFPGVFPNADRVHLSLVHSQEAVRLDPGNSRAHLSLAWSYALARQPEMAALHCDLARELNDNDTWSDLSATTCRLVCGNGGLTLEEVRSRDTTFFEPLHWAYHFIDLFLLEDMQGAIAVCARAGQSLVPIIAWMSAAYALTGQAELAANQARQFFAIAKQRWHSAETADEAAITRWMLNAIPLQGEFAKLTLHSGLAAAGFPLPSDLD